MLEKEISLEIKFTLIKKEQTKNVHGDPFHVLHFRAEMPGRRLFLKPVHIAHYALDKLGEAYLRQLLFDALITEKEPK